MPKITPFLCFNNQAEEAIAFYFSVFKDAKLLHKGHFGPEGKFLTAEFELNGQRLMVLDGGPHFVFSDAISLFVHCDTQQQVDELWEMLSAGGGEKGRCGWLKDKFGVSWQVIPAGMGRLLQGGDPAKSQRALQAMMQMSKIDMAVLEQAYHSV